MTQEIGDTWISGVPSDPLKVARYLELARLRSEWIASEKLQVGDATDRAFLSSFLLAVEHTWGADIKTWLDFDHYTAARSGSRCWSSRSTKWCCPVGRKSARTCWMRSPRCPRRCAPRPPRAFTRSIPSSRQPPDCRRTRAAEPIETKHFEIALDPQTGAICRLHSKKTGRDWASTRPAAGLVFLPDALERRFRPLLCRLSEDPRGLGGDGFRQAQYRAFRRREPHLAAVSHRLPARPAMRRVTRFLPSSRSTMPKRKNRAGSHGRKRCTWN